MKVNLEDISSIEKKLTVTILKEKVNKEYSAILSKVKKSAAIKGFRRGKVPVKVIEANYGQKIVEELITKLVEGSFKQALKLKELNPVAQPSIKLEAFKKDEDFTYTMTVELVPEFEVADYSSFEVDSKKTAVEESEITEALNVLNEQNAIFKETEDGRAIQSSDMVIFDFTGFLADGTQIKDGHKENFSVVVGSNTLIPGFEEKLIGFKKGDEKEFTITFPEEYFEPEYAGVDVKFKVKINEIKEKELHEINDDFAKTLGDHETLDELKAYVKQHLADEKEKQNKLSIREQIVDKLIDTNEFEVPKSLVEKQLDYIVNEAKQRLTRQGADVTKISSDDVRENSREMAYKMVKRDLILGKIVEKEGFSVDNKELDERYEVMANDIGKDVAMVKEYYKKVNAEQSLRDDILLQKVFDKIADTANIKEA